MQIAGRQGFFPARAAGYWGLYIEARTAGATVAMSNTGYSLPTITLEYSTNGTTWQTFTPGTTSVTLAAIGDRVYFRAGSTDNSKISGGYSSYRKFTCTGSVNVGGALVSLLTQTETTAWPSGTGTYTFYKLFSGCTGLVDASGLIMPAATYVYSGGYREMFAGCTNLVAAPALPATSLDDGSYRDMFNGCTSLATAPALPAMGLTGDCYRGMFAGCTALTTAPTLPATSLTQYCYAEMFNGCTSLTATPSMAATSLARWCCQYMFQGCTALTSATVPTAGAYAECYRGMFYGCSSLVAAPALPTSIATGCFREMFRDCTALTSAPALPATSIASDCYRDMFYGCTSLTSCPALPATTLASDCYHMMFAYCSSLTTPMATLPATTLASACYDTMFYFCTSLTRSPELMATDTSQATNCYSWMFWGCSNLAEVTTKQTSFANCGSWLNGVAANGVFKCPEVLGDDSTIARGPSACPYNWTVDNGVYWGLTISATQANSTVAMAANGSAPSITLEYSTDNGEAWTAFVPGTTTVTLAAVGDKVSIRAGANGNATLATSTANYHRFAFTGGVALSGNAYSLLTQTRTTTLPSGTTTYALAHIFRDNSAAIDASMLMLPDLTLTINSVYQYMFYNCTGLTAAPALPATTVSYAGYANMFQGCTALTTAPALPATTISGWCYGDMFHGCTALTTVPATLPATTLASDCYNGMFHSCSSLTVAPALPATTLASQCYRTMFQQTGLLESPVLPAETQATRCYYGMFWYCPNIHKITTKQTSFSGCRAWVDGVPSTGEFVCNTDALGDNATITRGASACPTGWTVSAAPSGHGYFYVEARGAGAGVTWYHGSNSPVVVLDYSTDNGATWQQFDTNGQDTITLSNIGDRVYFRAGSGGNTRFAAYDSWYNNFSFQTAQVAVGGNIMTLLDATEMAEFVSADTFAFSSLFRNQGQLVDASALILPATTLTGHCYQYMFEGCSNMTAGPQILATTVSGVDATCAYMFRYCSAMTSAPALLAATVADNCYYGMFMSCSALAVISTAQTSFDGCGEWVQGVASSGTFTCPTALGTSATISRGSSACPNNWTVVNT